MANHLIRTAPNLPGFENLEGFCLFLSYPVVQNRYLAFWAIAYTERASLEENTKRGGSIQQNGGVRGVGCCYPFSNNSR